MPIVLSFSFERKRYRACVLVKELRTTNEVRGVCFLQGRSSGKRELTFFKVRTDFFFPTINAQKHYFFQARTVKSQKKKNGETTRRRGE